MTTKEVVPEVGGATTSYAPSGARLPSLTALRIVAATLVFIHHSAFQPLFSDEGVQKVYNKLAYNIGPISITFFFVLSGFVLTWTAKPLDTAKQFWRRRFVKIFPSHLVVYAIVLVLMLLAGRAVPWPEALVSLGLLQAWVPSNDYLLFAINPPTWSLSIELLFYLCFPLLLILVNRIRPSRLWLYAGLAAVAGLLLVPAVSWLFLPDSPSMSAVSPFSWPQLWFNYFFPVTRMFEFLGGMILAKILLTGRWPNVRPLFTVVLLVVTWAATLPLPLNLFEGGYHALFIMPIALVITAAAAADIAGRRTLFNSRGMVWLGEISYTFYLVHVAVLFSLQAAFNHQWGVGGMFLGDFTSRPFGTVAAIAFLVGAYLACVLVGWVVYALVERPAMRRWARPRGARPAGTTSAST
ncbi:peptidoglycan/LPS O-acetylase OafA/YrhL [Micromonospora sp. M71_S20]|uniref:acyltransferase family protein n=1 Tax=Micromonospora sp. M71_S20 TaxID=592872 RepID=UPI000EAD7CDD|nr:acyltransferase [Micromonospora sp. M71_S20]RLK09650.1 peptidoglycan/LPS O-acetylase OafA/YrhL [Micromonospora sp. M71_S20]